MERYRKFGDASTGIHPFTVVIAPVAWGVVAAAVVFPFRMFLSTLFALLLLVADSLSYLFYMLHLSLAGRLLLAPLQRLLLRGLLFFAGHILVDCERLRASDGAGVRRRGRASSSASSSPSALCGGDVVFVNMQSVWDVYVLEVALSIPYYAVAFPCPAGSRSEGSAGGCGVKLVGPGPLQRWVVWSHVRTTGTLAYLTALAAALATDPRPTSPESPSVVDLAAVQSNATVPIFYFAEGTCGNGKGLLSFHPLTLSGNHTTTRAAKPSVTTGSGYNKGRRDDDDSDDGNGEGGGEGVGATTAVAAITYNTPALQNVVSEGEGPLAYLFRASKLLYGSASPAWSSPFFPTALVQLNDLVKLDGARPVTATTAAQKEKKRDVYFLSTAAVDSVRDAMCMKGIARVASTGAGGVRRQPLSVGVAEKVGFVEAYIAANGGKERKSSS